MRFRQVVGWSSEIYEDNTSLLTQTVCLRKATVETEQTARRLRVLKNTVKLLADILQQNKLENSNSIQLLDHIPGHYSSFLSTSLPRFIHYYSLGSLFQFLVIICIRFFSLFFFHIFYSCFAEPAQLNYIKDSLKYSYVYSCFPFAQQRLVHFCQCPTR